MEPLKESVPVIDLTPKYWTLPKNLIKKAGLPAVSDVVLYCRPSVLQQIEFLTNRVTNKSCIGVIIGPPGMGKSICSLAYMASLDLKEWRVIWFHLGKHRHCLMLEPDASTLGIQLTDKIELP